MAETTRGPNDAPIPVPAESADERVARLAAERDRLQSRLQLNKQAMQSARKEARTEEPTPEALNPGEPE